MSCASTVDIIADIGAAKKIPATIGGSTSNIKVGMTLSIYVTLLMLGFLVVVLAFAFGCAPSLCCAA